MRPGKDIQRRRSQPLTVEPLEGRALLSTVQSVLPPPSAIPASLVATNPNPSSSSANSAAPIHVDGVPAHPAVVKELLLQQTASERKLGVDTAKTASTKATSADLGHATKQYAKLIFSHESRQVGWSYAKAAFRLNGKKLHQLGHSASVKQLGQNFSNVGKSKQAKAVGNSLHKFGSSVSKRFHKVFH